MHLMRRRVFSAHESHRLQSLHGVPLASFWARGGAIAVDLFLINVLTVSVTSFVTWLRLGTLHSIHARFVGIDTWWALAIVVVYFGVLTYFGRGQSPGKRLFHIRVVSLVSSRLTLWHSIERALGYGASALEAGFGFVQYFIHPNAQTAHDRIAETIVVDERVNNNAT